MEEIKINCDHTCTSNCRREGCNCECGEWHIENPVKEYDSLAHLKDEKTGKYDLKLHSRK